MLERLALVALGCTAIVLTAFVVIDRLEQPPAPLGAGDLFPELTLTDSAGQDVSPLSSADDGFVVFFSTGCPYCIASLPVLREIARERCDLAVTIVFLDVDVSGREMGEWWTTNGLADACGPIRFGSLGNLPKTFGVTATPTFFLLSEDRRIVHRALGVLTEFPEWLH